ncbi:MAG TPA: hypothetical protein VFX16_13570 [Pseudonocardiaceae bacterium]|nr:hypothetical protein [Pseudonocardiaceae bacterium]
MAGFHASATRSPRIAAQGGRDALWTRWTDNFRQAERFRDTVLNGRLLDDIERLATDFLAGRAEALAQAIAATTPSIHRGEAAGRVFRGHRR